MQLTYRAENLAPKNKQSLGPLSHVHVVMFVDNLQPVTKSVQFERKHFFPHFPFAANLNQTAYRQFA